MEMDQIKELMKKEKYVEVVRVIEEVLPDYDETDRDYFTLLNNYTRACLGRYEVTEEAVYYQKFQKTYLKMMDLQNAARAARFDITRYRKTYQKHYRFRP